MDNLIKISCSIYATVHSGSGYWTADFYQIAVTQSKVSFLDNAIVDIVVIVYFVGYSDSVAQAGQVLFPQP